MAPLVLAQLAGVLARYRSVRSATNAPVDLPFSVIEAMRDTPTLSMALVESSKLLAELQQKHLDVAAGFDRKRAEALMARPRMFLPADALPSSPVEPKDVDHWRRRLVCLYQQPLFWLETPGAKELRTGFMSSFDRTLLATYANGSWLEKLTAPKRDREANRLGALLAQLVQGGHLSLPASAKNTGPVRFVQAHFGLVGLATSETLTRALKDEREDVRALLGHTVLLDLPKTPNPAAVTRSTVSQMQAAGDAWRHMVSCLLDERRAVESRCLEAHDCFHEALSGWPGHLQSVATGTPPSLHRHLAAFADLPRKLGSLLLAIGQYGVWRDADAAKGAWQIAEWMLGRTLRCAGAAQEDRRRFILVDAREKMLAKIRELGPIDFWRLCRHFDQQSKALHEPTLHALLDEKLVCLNDDGRLVAA